jgi:hypothetical protein
MLSFISGITKYFKDDSAEDLRKLEEIKLSDDSENLENLEEIKLSDDSENLENLEEIKVSGDSEYHDGAVLKTIYCAEVEIFGDYYGTITKTNEVFSNFPSCEVYGATNIWKYDDLDNSDFKDENSNYFAIYPIIDIKSVKKDIIRLTYELSDDLNFKK